MKSFVFILLPMAILMIAGCTKADGPIFTSQPNNPIRDPSMVWVEQQ